MQINNQLLKYTLLNKTGVNSLEINAAATDAAAASNVINIVSDLDDEVDGVYLNGELAGVSGVMTDEEYAKAISQINSNKSQLSSSQVKLATTYSDLTAESIKSIKEAIFKIHHSDYFVPQDVSYYSFIDNDTFKGVDTLVDWLKTEGSWDNEKNGLPVKNLIKLTQNDALEDANRDFFGALNRAFLYEDAHEKLTLDSLDEETKKELNQQNLAFISYAELTKFFEAISEISEFESKVEDYSNNVQLEYDKMDNQQKLEWSIDKTREYLEYMGMTAQFDALDRMTKTQNDLYNNIHVGNIALADLNKDSDVNSSIDLGAYSYYSYFHPYNGDTFTYNNYDFKTWSSDNDKNVSNDDLGITLDIRLVKGESGYDLGNWYDLINTLVHELTHATAYRYYDSNGEITKSGLELLKELGVFSSTDNYTWEIVHNLYEQVQWQGNKRVYAPPALIRLEYLAYTAWGEYVAYQADADYLDSIGGDIYSNEATTAVNGNEEASHIEKHIQDLYNGKFQDSDGTIYNYTEAKPDWQWWSYA